jgi:hypothetical protein
MKTIKLILITAILIITNSCSSSGSDSSCDQIVCGTPGSPIVGKYYIYKGTLETCGETELEVNEATFLYYQAKWQANPEGYTCWEGLK